ncbi:hypothetical protein DL93DRAFT_767519 [Clavulina sp. PMI_390]|nr:hypothetical protein DL93DRAFT_767519 [Clavulina sp. PMI_390]
MGSGGRVVCDGGCDAMLILRQTGHATGTQPAQLSPLMATKSSSWVGSLPGQLGKLQMGDISRKVVNFHNHLHRHVLSRSTNDNIVDHPRTGEPVDVTIKFIQASDLPRMDFEPGALADPYFIANIDGKTSYVSTAQPNTLTPVWNETWNISNVPSDAKLRVDVHDKDEGSIVDDYIGYFVTDLKEGTNVETLKGLVHQDKGKFGLQISVTPSGNTEMPPYSFNGPIRYSRHFSPTAGAITKVGNPDSSRSRSWSTWKIAVKGVEMLFGNEHQHWNVNYKAAQTIFQGPLSFTVRVPIQAGHRLLYGRTSSNSFGVLTNSEDFWGLFRAGPDRLPKDPLEREKMAAETWRIKPAVYTYVIGEDDMFRFSETGAAFFVDFASKHALHSCCAQTVRYSGEFHPRPVYPDGSGWASFSEATQDKDVEWEIVIDNNSGTYAPSKLLLPKLKALLEFNFPGLHVVVYDYQDNSDALKASVKACRDYATNNRPSGAEQVTPGAEETSLFKMAEAQPAEMIMGLAKGSGDLNDNPAAFAGAAPPPHIPSTSAGGSSRAAPTMTSSPPRVEAQTLAPAEPLDPPPEYSFPSPSFPAYQSEKEAPPQDASARPPPPQPGASGTWIPAHQDSIQDGMPEARIWQPPPQAF